jgi:hypothetical protein
MIRHPDLDALGPDELGRPRWNTTTAMLAAHPELTAYRVTPHPLERVWAGDDAANPTITVALRFTDAAQESAALAAFNRTDTPGG